MKNFKWSYLDSLILFLMALVCGVTQGVCMADAVIADLPDAGKTVSRNEGGLTETVGREAIPEMYLSDIDKRITRIRPMATPIDQISRYGKAIECDSMEVKYYSVGTKPIKTTVKTAFEKQSSGTSTTLEVTDASMFDESDTIRVVGIKGYINGEEGQPSTEDLMLHVIGASDSNGQPVVYAVNGLKASDGQPTMLPAIAQDTVLIRLGKACAELDAQPFGRLLLGDVPLTQQVHQGVGLLEHVQVLALEVFQQGQHGAVLGGAVRHQGGNLPKACQLAGPQPPFPGNKVIHPVFPADRYRLEQPVLPDALGQGLQLLLGEYLPGLGGIGMDAVDGQPGQFQLVLEKHVPRLPFVIDSTTGEPRHLLFPVGWKNFYRYFLKPFTSEKPRAW